MKKIVSNLLIILIIIFLINIWYSKIVLKDNLIKIFGKSFVIVTTGSMEPEINTGELVIISEMKEYKKGDIITYEADEGFLVTHRLIEINENNFIAKGDSNNINDEPILNTNIKGRVIYHSKMLGYFVLYFLKPIVVIYIILFVGINLYFAIFNRNNKVTINEKVQPKNIKELESKENNKKEEEINEKS